MVINHLYVQDGQPRRCYAWMCGVVYWICFVGNLKQAPIIPRGSIFREFLTRAGRTPRRFLPRKPLQRTWCRDPQFAFRPRTKLSKCWVLLPAKVLRECKLQT